MEALQNFFESFRFASPFLSLGGLAGFLLFFFFIRKRRQSEKHSHLDFLGGKRLFDGIWQKLFFILSFAILTSVLVAAANPEVVEEIKKPLESKDIAIVLDTSGSMMIGFYPDDILPKFERTRLGVAWQFLREFIKMRKEDRIAIIPYDDPRGYVARGFTDDQEQLLSIFAKEEMEGVYEYSGDDPFERSAIYRGTNTPNAIEGAEDYFKKESKAETKLIILVTDLDDDPYGIPEALVQARKKGIVVYTIGIVGERVQGRLERFKSFFNDEGLRFFAIQDREDLILAIRSIDQMETSLVEIKQVVALHSISWIFIIAALFLTAIFIAFGEKFKKIP